MLLYVVCEYNFCVQGRIDTAGEQKLDGLVEVVHARNRCAVGFCLRCIGAGNGVGGRFALEIFHGVDLIVIAAHDNSGAVICIRGREVVLFRALFGDAYAVDHDVITAVIKTGKQAVPLALDKVDLYAELFCDVLRNFYVIADKVIIGIVVCPRRPSAFHRNRDGALFLDLREQVVFFRCGRLAFCFARCRGNIAAACRTGRCAARGATRKHDCREHQHSHK